MNQVNLIMLVDDDPMTSFINNRILKIIGYTGEAISFQTAQEALKYLLNCSQEENSLPDLILTDINMPYMNGWQFLDAFAKICNLNKDISIVMLTNSVNPEDNIRSSQYDMVDHIMKKPLTAFELKKLLKMHISQNKLIAS